MKNRAKKTDGRNVDGLSDVAVCIYSLCRKRNFLQQCRRVWYGIGNDRNDSCRG